MADFKQIRLIARFTDLSLNDTLDSMERSRSLSEGLLRLKQFHQHSMEAITTDASVFEVNYNHYEFELSV